MGIAAVACHDASLQPVAPVPISDVSMGRSGVEAPPDAAVALATPPRDEDGGAAGLDASASDASATVVTPSVPTAVPKPRAPSWIVSFPRRTGAQPWCKTEHAVCYDGAKDLAKCPKVEAIPCERYNGPDLGRECSGELMKPLSQRERGKYPTACCYDAHARCPHPGEGRPFRPTDDAMALANLIRGASGWSITVDRVSVDLPKAAAWAKAALREHASIASFAKLALDLLTHGAPADLVRRTHAAALDEIAHAEASFAMAARFSPPETPWGPGPLVASTFGPLDLRGLVRETFVDGCIGETLAALDARVRAQRTDDDEERRVLSAIAEDEERHAELAWAIVAWGASVSSEVLEGLSAGSCPDVEVRESIVGPCVAALRAYAA